MEGVTEMKAPAGCREQQENIEAALMIAIMAQTPMARGTDLMCTIGALANVLMDTIEHVPESVVEDVFETVIGVMSNRAHGVLLPPTPPETLQ